MPWSHDDADPHVDMWVTPDETREHVVGLYRRAWQHGAETIDALGLDATGKVPWWPPERATVTLGKVLVHLVAETHRHAGHADIVRELVDGAVGLRPGNDNLPPGTDWVQHRRTVERAAAGAAGMSRASEQAGTATPGRAGAADPRGATSAKGPATTDAAADA